MPVSRPIRLTLLAAAVAVVLVQPAFAQNSARIFGIVTDHEGNRVDGASVLMEFQGGLTRSFETSSNAQGEYIQVGLASGPYLVTITAEGIGVVRYNLRVSAGEEFELDVQVLGRGQVDRTGLSAEEIAELEAREATADAFEGGLEAARGGNYDEAAQLLAEAIEVTPDCGECLRKPGQRRVPAREHDRGGAGLLRATGIGRGRRGGNSTRLAAVTTLSGASMTRGTRAPRRPGCGAGPRAGAAAPARCSIRASPPGTRGVPMKPAATSSRPWSWIRATARRTTGWGWRA